MQALFYIGLFGTFFFVMSGITVGMARTTMQLQLDKENKAQHIFSDIEYAINKIVLSERLSLDGESTTNIDYVIRYLSWGADEVRQDPWGANINMIRLDENQVIAAFGGGQNATAQVSHFAIISGGKDRAIQTATPTTITEWRTLHSAGAVGDDIVKTFSTRGPMMKIWNNATEVEDKIREIAISDYQQRIEQYSPITVAGGDNDVGDFTNCAIIGQTGNAGGLNCARFTASAITECGAMHTYNLAVRNGSTAVRPVTAVMPSTRDIDVTDCWKFDPVLKANVRFPTMAGSPNSSTARNCAGQSNCTVLPYKVGISSTVERDPFGGLRFVYNDNEPDTLRVVRNINANGWSITKDTPIRSK